MNSMINQHEANIVKYIFESYAKGHGYRRIANALNHKGYVTKKGKPFSIVSCYLYLSLIHSMLVKFNLRNTKIGMKNDVKD